MEDDMNRFSYLKYILKGVILASMGIPCCATADSPETGDASETGNDSQFGDNPEAGDESEIGDDLIIDDNPEIADDCETGGDPETGGDDEEDETTISIVLTEELQQALTLIQANTNYSDLTGEERALLETQLHVDLPALETMEALGMQLMDSIAYAQAVPVSGLSVEALIARYPNVDDCAAYIYENFVEEKPVKAPEISTMAAPLTTCDEPKEYLDAPFGYNYSDNESVTLNSGSLEYSVTDFVLPGKNGMDLAMTRTYSSSSANTRDLDVLPTTERMGYYEIRWTATLKGIYGTKGTISIKNKLLYRSSQIYAADVLDERAEAELAKWEKGYGVGWEYTDNGGYYEITKSNLSYTRQKSTCPCWYTGTRDNTHLIKAYGLGYGWSFALPSIEMVPETLRTSKVIYKNFLHLGDGRAYEIDGSTLKKYTLTDLTLQKGSGSLSTPYNGTVTYDYKLTYKDGKIAYFQAQKSGSSVESYKLVAMQDRFGNTITYRFTNNGGASITDTLGRTISLVKITGGMQWRLFNGDTINYTIGSNRLTKVTDQEGRATSFGYTAQSAMSCFFGSDYADPGATISFYNLTTITHPTNAKTTFTYGTITEKSNLTDGYHRHFGLTSRKDVENGATRNSITYSYGTNGGKLRYIQTATVTRPDLVVSTHTFADFADTHLQSQEVVKHAGKNVSSTAFTYNTNKLLIKQATTTYNESSQYIHRVCSWTYDAKGNRLTEVDPLSNTTTYVYNATYSLPTSKVYKKDSATTITEEYTLGLSNRAVQWTKVYETAGGVKTIRQATQYLYDGNYNVSEERRYYGNLTALNTYYSTLITYLNNNPALGSGYNGVFPTVTQATGVLDADGVRAYGDGVVRTEVMYDWYGRAIQKTDPLGNVSATAYDRLGRAVQVTHPDGTRKSNTYDDSANTITATDENGNQMLYRYTPLGQIQQVTDLTTGTVLKSMAYDHLNRPATETDLVPSSVELRKS